MTQSGHEFEDDNLRQALRRAFPAEQAPPDLRKRVAAMLRGEEMWMSDEDVPGPVRLTQPAGPIPSAHTPVAWLGNFFQGARRVALAACFAGLTMGIALFVAMQTSGSLSGSSPSQVADAGQIPPFVQAAVVRHDELLQADDSARPVSSALRPLPQVRSEVQKHLPMPEADVLSQGWQLLGGKTWQAGSGMVAQIFYRRGQETLSVFIMPPDARGWEVQTSTGSLKDHLVATRRAPKFTVCVVGYSPEHTLKAQEVDRVAEVFATR